jgi:hypothetical protein
MTRESDAVDFASRDSNRLTRKRGKMKTKKRIDQTHERKLKKSMPRGKDFTAQSMIAHNKPHRSHLASVQEEGRQMAKHSMCR